MGKEWAMDIKADILNIKQRLTALESQVQVLQSGNNGNAGGSTGAVWAIENPMNDFGEGFYNGYLMNEGSDKKGNWTDELIQATYAIKTASVAVRGYLMALDQANLSPDQQKMLRQLEEIQMAISKVVTGIQMARLVMSAASPEMAIINLIIAGGFFASSAAYMSKIPADMTSEVS